jgi:hypothetical protein
MARGILAMVALGLDVGSPALEIRTLVRRKNVDHTNRNSDTSNVNHD